MNRFENPVEGDIWDHWNGGDTIIVTCAGSKLITYRYTHWGAKERTVQIATFRRMCRRSYTFACNKPEHIELLRTERLRA